MVIRNIYYALFLLLLVCCNTKKKEKNFSNIPQKKENNIVSENLFDTINVEGKITDIAYGYCGMFCTGGMIEVKIDTQKTKYINDTVYIITACMSQNVKKNTKINVIATKLKITDSACYYLNFSKIDAISHDYLKLDEFETRKIGN